MMEIVPLENSSNTLLEAITVVIANIIPPSILRSVLRLFETRKKHFPSTKRLRDNEIR